MKNLRKKMIHNAIIYNSALTEEYLANKSHAYILNNTHPDDHVVFTRSLKKAKEVVIESLPAFRKYLANNYTELYTDIVDWQISPIKWEEFIRKAVLCIEDTASIEDACFIYVERMKEERENLTHE